MNKNIIKGNWHEIKGKVMQTWSKLTDDNVTRVKGKKEELRGLLEKNYGYDKERADKEIADFIKKHGLE